MDEENKREKSNLELQAEDEVKIACARDNPNRKEGEFDDIPGYAEIVKEEYLEGKSETKE